MDGGAGDWRGARIVWRNQRQALEVGKIIPLPVSSQLRVMPLEQFTLSSGFNQSLTLRWNDPPIECTMMKTTASADHLARARAVMNRLPASKSAK